MRGLNAQTGQHFTGTQFGSGVTIIAQLEGALRTAVAAADWSEQVTKSKLDENSAPSDFPDVIWNVSDEYIRANDFEACLRDLVHKTNKAVRAQANKDTYLAIRDHLESSNLHLEPSIVSGVPTIVAHLKVIDDTGLGETFNFEHCIGEPDERTPDDWAVMAQALIRAARICYGNIEKSKELSK